MLWTIFLEIGVALLLGLCGWWLYVWAVRSGQFDDLEGPAHRILMDKAPQRVPTNQLGFIVPKAQTDGSDDLTPKVSDREALIALYGEEAVKEAEAHVSATVNKEDK